MMKSAWRIRNGPNKTDNDKTARNLTYYKDMKNICVHIENGNITGYGE